MGDLHDLFVQLLFLLEFLGNILSRNNQESKYGNTLKEGHSFSKLRGKKQESESDNYKTALENHKKSQIYQKSLEVQHLIWQNRTMKFRV